MCSALLDRKGWSETYALHCLAASGMRVVIWDSELSRVRGVSGCICFLYAIAIPVTRAPASTTSRYDVIVAAPGGVACPAMDMTVFL